MLNILIFSLKASVVNVHVKLDKGSLVLPFIQGFILVLAIVNRYFKISFICALRANFGGFALKKDAGAELA